MRSKWSWSSGWQPSSNLPLHHLLILQILTESQPGWTLRTTDRRSRKFFSIFGTMEAMEEDWRSSPTPPAAQATTTKKSPMRRNPFSWDCVRTRRIRPLPPSPISEHNNNVMPESADDTPKSGAGSHHEIPLLDGTKATPVHIPSIPPMHNQRPKASKFSSTAHR